MRSDVKLSVPERARHESSKNADIGEGTFTYERQNMCYKKPGLRCAIDILPRLQAHKKLVEDRKASLRDAEEDGTNATVRRLTEKLAFAETSLGKVQQEWDLTPQGIQEIRDAASVEGVSAATKTKLEAHAMRCEKKRAKRIEELQASKNNLTTVRSLLESHGVSQEAIHEIEELSKKDSGSAYGRASAYYRQQKDKWEAEVGHLTNEINYAVRKGNPADREQIIESYGSKVAHAYHALREAQFAFDTCPEGLASLEQRLANGNLTVRERAELKARLAHCKKFHKTQLDDRYLRQQKERLIKQAMRSVGKDYRPVLKAIRKNGSQKSSATAGSATNKSDPQFSKTVDARVWMTAAEKQAVEQEFRKSPEYAEARDVGAAYARFLERKIMTPPSEYHSHQTLDDLNSATPWQRGTGEVGRPATTANKKNLRDASVRVKLTPVQNRIRQQWVKHYKMSASSLMRCPLTGTDPRAIQNDRSRIHNTVKTEAMRNLG